jgi:DNA polymerase-1
MTKTALLIDTHYLCHRAYHAMGAATMGGPGMVFGVMRDITTLLEMFVPDRVLWAFDDPGGTTARAAIVPGYKSGRRARHAADAPEAREQRIELSKWITRLRREFLPNMGFANIVKHRGYEADDVLAVAVDGLPPDVTAVIVASDADLYQLLTPAVCIYNPRTRAFTTYAGFMARWGIYPPVWAEVKAWAGCPSDDIPGCRGVGEKTAVKWLTGQLKDTTGAYETIVNSIDVYTRNIQVTRLPLPGCPPVRLRPERWSSEGWAGVARTIGARTIVDRPPSVFPRVSRGRKHA